MLFRIAAATCETPIPRLASFAGSSCTRTAYLLAPITFTCATPSTMESCWPMVVSANSSICCIDNTLDVSVMFRIGDAAGFCLR